MKTATAKKRRKIQSCQSQFCMAIVRASAAPYALHLIFKTKRFTGPQHHQHRYLGHNIKFHIGSKVDLFSIAILFSLTLTLRQCLMLHFSFALIKYFSS